MRPSRVMRSLLLRGGARQKAASHYVEARDWGVEGGKHSKIPCTLSATADSGESAAHHAPTSPHPHLLLGILKMLLLALLPP